MKKAYVCVLALLFVCFGCEATHPTAFHWGQALGPYELTQFVNSVQTIKIEKEIPPDPFLK